MIWLGLLLLLLLLNRKWYPTKDTVFEVWKWPVTSSPSWSYSLSRKLPEYCENDLLATVIRLDVPQNCSGQSANNNPVPAGNTRHQTTISAGECSHNQATQRPATTTLIIIRWSFLFLSLYLFLIFVNSHYACCKFIYKLIVYGYYAQHYPEQKNKITATECQKIKFTSS